MPLSCTSCASQLFDHAALCTTCGSVVSPPASAASPGGDQEPPPESSMPGGIVGSDASAAENPAKQVGQAGAGLQIPIAPTIAVCGMLLAVLAGIGVTVIDYPWQQVFGVRHSLAWAPASPVAAASPPPVTSSTRLAPEASASAAPVVAGPSPAVAPSAKHEARPAGQVTARKGAGKAKSVAVAATERRPAVVREAPSIDERYQAIVKKECRSGFFGILCGESVRWRLCDGRWNDGDQPGETRCQVGRKSREGGDQFSSSLG